MQSFAGLQRFGRLRRDAMTEARCAVEKAKENRFCCWIERLRFAQGEKWLVKGRTLLHHDPIAADHICSRCRITRYFRNDGVVVAALCRAIDATAGISETRFRT